MIRGSHHCTLTGQEVVVGEDGTSSQTTSLFRAKESHVTRAIDTPLPQAVANAFALSIVSGDVWSAAISSTNFYRNLELVLYPDGHGEPEGYWKLLS
jgi:hypothetical protein